MIPYGKQDITEEDINSVIEVLKSDFITQGPLVPEFERRVAEYCTATGAIAANSATSALHLACLSLGLGRGDYLWTSPITFVASANCGLYCGAEVDFVDIDVNTYNLCPDKLKDKLEEAELKGTLPKIIVLVHFAGQSCEMKKIHQLAIKYGISIIEDASHAIGGKYLAEPIGGCKFSEITIFSFHPVKIITTAEGGIATSNNPELLEKMQLMRSHGITRNKELINSEVNGEWYYRQIALGFNYRMTEIQAALGINQLKRLDSYIEKRHLLATRYNNALQNLPLKLPFQHNQCYSSFHLYPVVIDQEKTDKTRINVFLKLRQQGIGVNVHYIPVHTQPFYQQLGCVKSSFPIAEAYYANTISLPLFSSMKQSQQDYIIEQLHEIF